MDPMTLTEIARTVGARAAELDTEIVATGASIDTRTLKPGDLFFALAGERADGAAYVKDALDKGASGAVVKRGALVRRAGMPFSRILEVEDPRVALWVLAAAHRQKLAAPLVAITGSCGKTTTREMTYAVLTRKLGKGLRSPASFNNDLGVPLTLLSMDRSHAFGVIELGANHPGEIRALARLVRPNVGVITNVRPAHLEGFKDLWGVARAKGELFNELPDDGVAIYNPAELGLSTIARRQGKGMLTFGASAGCSLRLRALDRTEGGVRLNVDGCDFAMPLESPRLAWNALAAIAVGKAFGMTVQESAAALADFEPPRGRMTRQTVGGVTLLFDAYNANPASMRAAIESMGLDRKTGRRVLILGDMLELGSASLPCHTELGRKACEIDPDVTITVGERVAATAAAMIARGMPLDRVRSLETTEAAALEIPGMLEPGDTVLLKASRALRFEIIRDAIASAFETASPAF